LVDSRVHAIKLVIGVTKAATAAVAGAENRETTQWMSTDDLQCRLCWRTSPLCI